MAAIYNSLQWRDEKSTKMPDNDTQVTWVTEHAVNQMILYFP